MKSKKRQGIRRAIIFISFLFFPVILYYFSPYLIIMGAHENVVSGSFAVFSVLFLSSLFAGRAFCGWVCGAGGMQEACFMFRSKQAKVGKVDWIKYFIWVPWVSFIIITAVMAGGFKRIDFFYKTTHGISVNTEQLFSFGIYYGITFLILILALTAGKRGFCHYVCWMAPFMVIGTKISNLLRLPALRLKSDKEKCVDCKLCTKNCPMSLDVNGMVHKGSMINSECILCGTCVDVCPKDVIDYTHRVK